MSDISHILDNADLRFFGKVNASISHELKNILAIVSETAGLMTDLMELAAKGETVDPETLMGCGRDIIEEIGRGFATIKQMNRFAHSVDTALADIDLYEVLELVIGLAGFLSYTGQTRTHRAEGDACVIQTCPFRLQYVIYTILTRLFKFAGPRANVEIGVDSKGDRPVEVTLSCAGSAFDGEFSLNDIEGIADSIKAMLYIDSDARSVRLVLPRAIDDAGPIK